MLAVVLLINIITLIACSPSRYPYVFLLDIGNEEIQATKSEQMRVSMGGGSATVRYPAVGDGDLITHVRVTSVDFGANLMASVMDGGPGYKYAVVAIAGNKNAPYDVLLSFETLKDSNNFQIYEPPLKVKEEVADVNDSSEDISDDIDSDPQKIKTDHNYDSLIENTDKDVSEGNVDINENSINESDHIAADESNTKYGNNQEEPMRLREYQQYYTDDKFPSYSSHSPDDRDTIERINPEEYNLIDSPRVEAVPKPEPYSFDPNEEQTGEEPSVVDQNLYNTYTALRPHLADDVQVNSYTPGDDVDRQVKVNEPDELDQMFNDEDIHNIIPKPEGSNKNYILDTDDTSAVAY